MSGKKFNTKINYARLICDYYNFCRENDVDPFNYEDKSLDVYTVIFWFANRTWKLGSCNSINTWSAALTWLCGSIGFPDKPPQHQLSSDFQTFKKLLVAACSKKPQAKTPCDAGMISKYIRTHLKVHPERLHEASYNNLMKAFLLVLMFMGAYRPSELVHSITKEEFLGSVKTVEKGLRWCHIETIEPAEWRGRKGLKITVPFWKNQKNEDTPLVKEIASPICDHKDCICGSFDFVAMYETLKQMRRDRHQNARPFNRSRSRKQLSRKRATALGTKDRDFVFVNSNGTVIEYDHLRNIIREMVVALGLPKNKFAVTPHGLRISATSTAYIQGIACLVMCRYVEWSVSTLGITHAQYVQVTDDKLATVPFDMLHGVLIDGRRENRIQEALTTFVLRKEVIKAELYGIEKTNISEVMRAKAKNNIPIPSIEDDDWLKWGPQD